MECDEEFPDSEEATEGKKCNGERTDSAKFGDEDYDMEEDDQLLGRKDSTSTNGKAKPKRVSSKKENPEENCRKLERAKA